jgi:cytochrome c556
MNRVLFLFTAVALTQGCAKRTTVAPEDIPKLPSLEAVMDAQATYADPQFKKIGRPTYAAADYSAFADAGARLVATSAKIKEFTKGVKGAAADPAGFDAFADQVHAQAQALLAAAAAQDAAGSSKALATMKEACRGCHKKYR